MTDLVPNNRDVTWNSRRITRIKIKYITCFETIDLECQYSHTIS